MATNLTEEKINLTPDPGQPPVPPVMKTEQPAPEPVDMKAQEPAPVAPAAPIEQPEPEPAPLGIVAAHHFLASSIINFISEDDILHELIFSFLKTLSDC